MCMVTSCAMFLLRPTSRLLLSIQFNPVDVLWNLLGLASIPALVALNAFFVAAEFSLVAVRKTRLQELIAHGAKGARSAQNAVDHLDRTIAATQLGITLSSIGLGWVAEVALANSLLGVFHAL